MTEQHNTPTPKKRRSGQRMTTTQRKAAQATFLTAFEKAANVTQACREACIDRSTCYQWLEHDEEFSILFHQAEQIANDAIRAEIFRRGHDGWDEDVYSFGKFQGTVRKYSDTLLIFLAKARMPEFRDKSTLDVNTNARTVEIYRVRIPDNGRDAS